MFLFAMTIFRLSITVQPSATQWTQKNENFPLLTIKVAPPTILKVHGWNYCPIFLSTCPNVGEGEGGTSDASQIRAKMNPSSSSSDRRTRRKLTHMLRQNTKVIFNNKKNPCEAFRTALSFMECFCHISRMEKGATCL